MAAPKTSIKTIKATVTAWQRRLNLTNWNIDVRWATKTDLADGTFEEGLDATIQWQIEHSHAVIRISKTCVDPEHTIIHELIHLANEGSREQPFKYDPGYERSINTLAALLGAGDFTKFDRQSAE